MPIKVVTDENLEYFKSLQDGYNEEKFALKGEAGADIATPDAAGIVKPGTDFDIAADGTLSLYEAMAVSSATVTPNQAERGSTVADVTVKWALSKVPQTLTLNDEPVEATATQKVLEGANVTQDTTYTVKAVDARGASAQRNATLYFRDKRHWFTGDYDADALTDGVLNAATGELATSRAKTFSVNAAEGQHIFYAFPHSWGTPAFFVGGFEGGFALLKTFDHVNASGATVSYDVYRSTNAGLGSTTVEVR